MPAGVKPARRFPPIFDPAADRLNVDSDVRLARWIEQSRFVSGFPPLY